MAKLAVFILGCAVFNSVICVPYETLLEESEKLEENPKLDNNAYGTTETRKGGQREKRFYNYFDYNSDFNFNPGFPQIPFRQNPIKRHPANSFGNFGVEDPLEPFHSIYNKLHEISFGTRDRTYLPPAQIQVPVPTFIPFIIIPRLTCDCSNSNEQPTNNNNDKPILTNNNPQNPNTKNPGKNNTVPDLPDRFPEMDDTRQNWGPNENQPDTDYDDENSDGARPISFQPIKPEEPLSVQPPAFDHGSVQAGLQPEKSPEATPPEVENSGNASPDLLPTPCDEAAVSCCHQPRQTMQCFQVMGCVDRKFIAQACEPKVLLSALQKLERLYQQKIWSVNG